MNRTPGGSKPKKEVTKQKTISDKGIKNIIKKMLGNKGNQVKEGMTFLLSDGYKETTTVKELFPFGILSMDIACGGGIPASRITELYGDFSTGKTLAALHAIKEVQNLGGVGLYGDLEGSFSDHFIKILGIDPSRFIYIEPGTSIETFLTRTHRFIENLPSHIPGMAVMDSVAGGFAKREEKRSYDTAEVAARALAMGNIRRLTAPLARSRVALILINQIRKKFVTFGDDVDTVGGNVIKFQTSLRVWIKKVKQIKKGEKVIGMHGRIAVTKNRFAPPFRKANIATLFSKGILPYVGATDILHRDGKLQKKAGWLQIVGTDIKFQKADIAKIIKQYPELLLPVSWQEKLKR